MPLSLAKSSHQFDNSLIGQFCLPTKIMRFQDFVDVARTVPCDGRDLRHAATGQGEPRYGGPAQVMEMQILVAEFRALEHLTPRGRSSS